MNRNGIALFGWCLVAALVLAAPSAFTQESARAPVAQPALKDYPIVSERRLELTRAYARQHYGVDSAELNAPRMVVVHYTATSSLSGSLSTFKTDVLAAARTDIAGHGDVNVGVHYLIARDGTTYRLLPEDVMGRHTIGFNWCALGIEMVAGTERDLSEAQLASCAHLVAWIASRRSSIEFLIGHHEYMDRKLPHASLFLEKDSAYAPTVKTDPGAPFMRSLRALLAQRYKVALKD